MKESIKLKNIKMYCELNLAKRGLVFVAAHSCSVVGLAVDGMNQILVTAGLDGEICFWGFKKHLRIDSLHLDNYISGIVLHRERYSILYKQL